MSTNSQANVSNALPHHKPAIWWIARISAAILVTLAAFALASYSRRALMKMGCTRDPEPESPPQPDPFEFGLVIQFIVVPIALIYLFSNTRLFRRVIGDQATLRDRGKFFAGLVLIELLTHSYNLGFSRLVKIQSPAEAGDTAIGLRNVDGRLRALYGEEYRLIVESEFGRGARVQIRVPIRDE